MHTRPHEKLIVWQKAYRLCLLIYKLTVRFPKEEKFGLANQMRRSSSSIPINIAEGNSRRSKRDKCRFLEIAEGSLEELHCETRIAKDLNYLSAEEYSNIDDAINKTSYLLMKLRSSLNK